TSVAAWVFFVMIVEHELIWVLKNSAFPDSSWENKQTIAGSIWFFMYLCIYWIMGWMLVSNFAPPAYPLAENAWFALCLIMQFVGCSLLAVSDAQKNLTLKLRPGLITTGMFRYLRHPNYLGQTLIYTSFAMMVWHWVAALIVGFFFIFIFLVNMIMKEASMSRHPQWAEYKRKTWWLFPGIF
ncbi:MAG: methyltransferase family protein, partial [Pseudobdellovibrionaceae bacterium]